MSPIPSPRTYNNWYQEGTQLGHDMTRFHTPTRTYPDYYAQRTQTHQPIYFQNPNDQTLMQKVQALEQENARLQTLFNTMNNLQPPMVNNSTMLKLKIAEPTRFGGKTSESYKAWVNNLELHFAATSTTSDYLKIICALGYLDGSASESVQVYHQYQSLGMPLGTWQEFKRNMGAIYDLKDKEGNARNELEQIRQTGSVAEYASKFQEIMSHLSHLDDHEKQYHFKRGLKYDLAKYLAARTADNRNAFLTIGDLINAANAYEQSMIAVQNMHPRQPRPTPNANNGSGNRPSQPRPATVSAPRDPNAMDIGAGKVDTRTCYNCNKSGHISRDCTAPRKPRQARANATHSEDKEMNEAHRKDTIEVAKREIEARYRQELEAKIEELNKQSGF